MKGDLCLVAGTMKETSGSDNVYVTAVLFTPEGTIAGHYRKRKPTIEGAVRTARASFPH